MRWWGKEISPARSLHWGGLGAPTPGTALEDVAVVQKPVEHGADGGGVAEEFTPVVDGPVRGEQGAGPLVAAHDDLQQILGSRVRELAHAEVVDDEERYAGDGFHVVFAGSGSDGIAELIEQDVRFAIQDLEALLDSAVADGLGEVAFAGAARPEKERVFAPVDEPAGGQIESRSVSDRYNITSEADLKECRGETGQAPRGQARKAVRVLVAGDPESAHNPHTKPASGPGDPSGEPRGTRRTSVARPTVRGVGAGSAGGESQNHPNNLKKTGPAAHKNKIRTLYAH